MGAAKLKRELLLKGGSLIDVITGQVLDNTDVLIEAGLIRRVGRVDSDETAHVRSVDCNGRFLIPGLFDCHTHLCALTKQSADVQREIHDECHLTRSFQEGRLAQDVLCDFVERGVTQVRDLGGPVETLKSFQDDIDSGELIGPDIFYAGPMLEKSPLRGQSMNERWPGWTVAVDSERDARSITKELHNQKAGCVKTFGKFDLDVLRALINLAAHYQLPVTHDPGPTFFHDVPIDKGIKVGLNCFEHGKSAWQVVLNDKWRAEHDSLKSADPKSQQTFDAKMILMGTETISMSKLRSLAAFMVERDVYFCPTLNIFEFYSEKPAVFTDKEPERYGRIFARLLDVSRVITSEMVRAKVKILVGQDGYIPRFTLNEMKLLNGVGLSNLEILRGATIYPAQWLGIADLYGTIDENKKANIAILQRNPIDDIHHIGTACMVIKGSQIIDCPDDKQAGV